MPTRSRANAAKASAEDSDDSLSECDETELQMKLKAVNLSHSGMRKTMKSRLRQHRHVLKQQKEQENNKKEEKDSDSEEAEPPQKKKKKSLGTCVWTLVYHKWSPSKSQKKKKKNKDDDDSEVPDEIVIYYQQAVLDPAENAASFHIIQKHSVRKKGLKTFNTIKTFKGKTIEWMVSAADDEGDAMVDEDGDEEYALWIDLQKVLFTIFKGDVQAMLNHLEEVTGYTHKIRNIEALDKLECSIRTVEHADGSAKVVIEGPHAKVLVEKVLQIETLAPMKDDAINMKTPTKFMGKTMNCDEEDIKDAIKTKASPIKNLNITWE